MITSTNNQRALSRRTNNHRADAHRSPGPRGGFTLVELLVTVALSIIILGMFAALYRWTTETYSQQKGNRRNDQRSRMLSIVIRADIQTRTFEEVVPYVPGQITSRYSRNNLRKGYFSISENDPDIDTDDVLAFTIQMEEGNTQRPYIGRATLLNPNFTTTPNRNQPEFDDGNPTANGSGQSTVAEVIYFVRNGTLYRRVLLVRNPYDVDGGGDQPTGLTAPYANEDANNNGVLDPMEDTNMNGVLNSVMLRDFDYSIWYQFRASAGSPVGPRFHGAGSSMMNEQPPTATAADGFPPVLGIPQLRFGGSLNRLPYPREYDSAGNFIGRFLMQETSDAAFLYPGNPTHTGMQTTDPYVIDTAQDPDGDTTDDNMTVNSNGIVSRFAGTSFRAKEDVLMTNVHAFDIKVFDEGQGVGQFLDLGHNGPATGHYHRSKNLRDPNFTSTTGPMRWVWNRFDTWHPFRSGTTSLGLPPYKASMPTPTTQIGPLGSTTGFNPERPLRAIQITIRFYDVPTKKMRQVTIIEHLGPHEHH